MKFSAATFVARWAAWAVVAAVWPAAAQQTLQFSKPVEKDPTVKANAFLPASSSHQSPDAFNAPAPLFGDRTPSVSFDVLPGAYAPIMSAAGAAQWKKRQDANRNWTLMTPEEILDIPTPEKILGITDPHDDPKQSLQDRFLERRQRMESAGATNNLSRPDAYWRDDPSSPFHSTDAGTRFAETLGGTAPDVAKKRHGFLSNLDAIGDSDPNRKTDATAWDSPFNRPEPLPKPTPEQLAGMDQFRALLEGPPPAAPHYSFHPVPAVDQNMQVLPFENPAGRSFTPLNNNMGKPTGLTPLPGVTGPRPTQAKPAPLVQPPPWMNETPPSWGSSPNLPQRQF